MSTVARFVDRARPWRAGPPRDDAPTVAVIGAGPAGLATAALLRRAGTRAILFDQARAVGGSWAGRYDSLRLNTVRWMSDLPGYRMPRVLGRWVGRDDIVGYLRDYADHHRLETRLGVVVADIERSDPEWSITVDGVAEAFDAVVVATGHSRVPVVPDWAGRDRFVGRLIHSSSYRRPGEHDGRDVVVVGAGSSGGEICVDLARSGRTVVWSVRSAPQVLPREAAHVPTTPFGPVADLLPDRWLDRLAPWAERRIHGARDYLPEPERVMTELLRECKEPMTADGIVAAVRSGAVRVVAALDRLDLRDVVLVDGSRLAADDVIAATGYRPGLEALVGGLDVLDDDGRPVSAVPLPGLGFVGFRIPLTGTLWALEDDAKRVAAALSS